DVCSSDLSSCITMCTDSRTRSTPSPARNASSSSDRADWDKAIGWVSFSVCLFAVSHRRSRRWPPTSRSPAVDLQTPPLQGTLLYAAYAAAMARRLVIKVTCGPEDPERCNQAFTVAAAGVASGGSVSLWLTGEAAWFAVPGKAEEFSLPLATPLATLRDTVLE